MIRFLIKKPIGVLMTFLALVILSAIAFTQVPISLLPDISVPKIVIRVNYPNASALEIEENILKLIREEMATLDDLEDIESKASNETGKVELTFELGAQMDLLYIEANERIDRINRFFPTDMVRPLVIKARATEVPIVRIQIIPKDPSKLLEVSELTERVIKKRIEQIEGVSIVDINGLRKKIISISTNNEQLSALRISHGDIIGAIRDNNVDFEGLSVRDGNYRYYVRLINHLSNIEDLKLIPIKLPGNRIIILKDVATIVYRINEPQGYHLFNQDYGLVINVHNNSNAKLTALIPQIIKRVELFNQDYPNVRFVLTQNQLKLLDSGINNLLNSLLYGGSFAFIILFFFMGSYRLSLVIGLSLPISFLISFFAFYLFNLSINIISLSGLVLGLGMLIDNAIIILDNITRNLDSSSSVEEGCINGINEIMLPLIASMLTTLAVFVPLVYLGGLPGVLFYDQAVSLTIILSVSLLVSFFLLPIIYKWFVGRQSTTNRDSYLFKKVSWHYNSIFRWSMRNKILSLIIITSIIPIGAFQLRNLSIEGIPKIQRNDISLNINWNEPISLEENLSRTIIILNEFEGNYKLSESDVGIHQYNFGDDENGIQGTNIYLLFSNHIAKEVVTQEIGNFVMKNYPNASTLIKEAPNIFNEIFEDHDPQFQARFKKLSTENLFSNAENKLILENLKQILKLPENMLSNGLGFNKESSVKLEIMFDKLKLYGIDFQQLQEILSQTLKSYRITEIQNYGQSVSIYLKTPNKKFNDILNSTFITNNHGSAFPLSSFINYDFVLENNVITADKIGVYQDIQISGKHDYNAIMNFLKEFVSQNDWNVDFTGKY